MHVGCQTAINKPLEVIKAMDIFLGVPSIFLDGDKERRKLYGGAGAHRVKPYGVEYRTLSNFWLWEDWTKLWVFQQTERAINFVKSGKEIPRHHGTIIRKAINNGDEKAAAFIGRAYYGALSA